MWNYHPLPLWSRAEILDGHWELLLATASERLHRWENSSTSLLSPRRSLQTIMLIQRIYRERETLSSTISPPPLELMLQAILIQESL